MNPKLEQILSRLDFSWLRLPSRPSFLLMIAGVLAISKILGRVPAILNQSGLSAVVLHTWIVSWLALIFLGYLVGTELIEGRYTWDRAGMVSYYRTWALRLLPLFVGLTATLWVLAAIFGTPKITSVPDLLFGELLTLSWDHTKFLNPWAWVAIPAIHLVILAPALIRAQTLQPKYSLDISLGLYALVLVLAYLYGQKGAHNIVDDRTILAAFLHFQAGIVMAQLAPAMRPYMRNLFYGIPWVNGALIAAFWLLCASFNRTQDQILTGRGMGAVHILAGFVLSFHIWLEEQEAEPKRWMLPLAALGTLSLAWTGWAGILARLGPGFFDKSPFLTAFAALPLALATSWGLARLTERWREEPQQERAISSASARPTASQQA